MQSRKGVVFAYGTLAVALIAGGSSFAYADKGGNKLNPNDIAAIHSNIAAFHSIVPKIGNPGIGNGLSGANSIASRAADKASDNDKSKSKERETAQSKSARSENAAASTEQEAVRIARLPSCT